ncbi:hypothetical protein [Clostridium cellulovorans]|uniref:Uncharacterized protein n=1 Tax=Clostridium cellulovorans (strain ATCC 35296 / DSM 3052 / OCM 3 / 743B) TaxID=573061 RepID=D9SVY3_CLOC7|nr:hypothetical protein [Clostridium cellulovorans]ADL53194.1 hypothetical protein Clocel_3518 [Clostridium cellulovorans 743B]
MYNVNLERDEIVYLISKLEPIVEELESLLKTCKDSSEFSKEEFEKLVKYKKRTLQKLRGAIGL